MPRSITIATAMAMGALALYGLAVAGSEVADAIAASPEPGVELPEPVEISEAHGLTDDEVAAALAPFESERLRCEPDGCERWRANFPARINDVLLLGELLVLQVDNQLVALDVLSGERRWAAPLDAPDGQGPAPRGVRESRLIVTGSDHVLLARETGHLRVLDQDGRHRWSSPSPAPGWIWAVQIIDDVVLTTGPPASPTDGSVALHAYDLIDGTPRWSRVVRDFRGTDHQVLVRTDEEVLVRLDAGSGEVTASYPGAAWGEEISPELLLLSDEREERSWLVITEHDHQLIEVAGRIETSLISGEVVFLVVLSSDRETEYQLIALGLDGEERWRRWLPLDPRTHCCPALAATEDGAIYVHDPTGAGAVLDGITGKDRPYRDPPPIPAGEWWTGNVSVEHGPRGLTIASRSGTALVPSDATWLVHDDPVVVGTRDALLGIELVAPPIGPRPPTRLPAS